MLKRGERVGKTKQDKGTKLMVLVDSKGTPIGIQVDGEESIGSKASYATLATVRIKTHQPQRLIDERLHQSLNYRTLKEVCFQQK